MQGWIKLHRSFIDWEWYRDQNTKILFLHLLLKAVICDKRVFGFQLKAGQLITTLPQLEEETGLSVQELRTSLKKLERTGEISQKSTNKFRLITIEKWAFYQDYPQEVNRQLTDKQQTTNRQLTGVKEEVKEKKNFNNNTYRHKPKNRFINYEQSNYDFDELERLTRQKRSTW